MKKLCLAILAVGLPFGLHAEDIETKKNEAILAEAIDSAHEGWLKEGDLEFLDKDLRKSNTELTLKQNADVQKKMKLLEPKDSGNAEIYLSLLSPPKDFQNFDVELGLFGLPWGSKIEQAEKLWGKPQAKFKVGNYRQALIYGHDRIFYFYCGHLCGMRCRPQTRGLWMAIPRGQYFTNKGWAFKGSIREGMTLRQIKESNIPIKITNTFWDKSRKYLIQKKEVSIIFGTYHDGNASDRYKQVKGITVWHNQLDVSPSVKKSQSPTPQLAQESTGAFGLTWGSTPEEMIKKHGKTKTHLSFANGDEVFFYGTVAFFFRKKALLRVDIDRVGNLSLGYKYSDLSGLNSKENLPQFEQGISFSKNLFQVRNIHKDYRVLTNLADEKSGSCLSPAANPQGFFLNGKSKVVLEWESERIRHFTILSKKHYENSKVALALPLPKPVEPQHEDEEPPPPPPPLP